MKIEPLYTHDCNRCKFIGMIKVPFYDFQIADFYKCKERYVLRTSSLPSDNASFGVEQLPTYFTENL